MGQHNCHKGTGATQSGASISTLWAKTLIWNLLSVLSLYDFKQITNGCKNGTHIGATQSGVSINKPIPALLTSSVDALFGRHPLSSAASFLSQYRSFLSLFQQFLSRFLQFFCLLCQQFLILLSEVFGRSVNNGQHLLLAQEVPCEALHPVSSETDRKIVKLMLQKVPFSPNNCLPTSDIISCTSAELVLLNDRFQ